MDKLVLFFEELLIYQRFCFRNYLQLIGCDGVKCIKENGILKKTCEWTATAVARYFY